MDYFTNVLAMFLCVDRGNILTVYGGSESKNILICVPKMNEGLTGLEQHEGVKLRLIFIIVFILGLIMTEGE